MTEELERLRSEDRPSHPAVGWAIVPLEPTEAMLDAAVAFALCVSLGGDYRWTDYMRDLWSQFLSAAPDASGSLSGGRPEVGANQNTDLVEAVARITSQAVEIERLRQHHEEMMHHYDQEATALETRAEEAEERGVRLREALTKARDQFEAYVVGHRLKGTSDGEAKARTNERLMAICDAALDGDEGIGSLGAKAPPHPAVKL